MGEKMKGGEVLLVLAGAFAVGYFISYWLSIPAVIVYFYFRLKKNKEDRSVYQNSLRKRNIDYFNSFGSTKEEREKNIKEIFESKQSTIKSHLFYDYKYKSVDHDIWIDQTRNLSIMEPKEREFLRATFLLFNENLISAEAFGYYLFAFVNGNGKASLDNRGWKHYYQTIAKAEDNNEAITYMNENCFKDNDTIVRFAQSTLGASVDSAITNLMKILQKLKSSDQAPAVVKEIVDRLHGGGAWLTDEDLKDSIFNGESQFRVVLGQLSDNKSILSYGGEGSLITIAPPGSGKTQCFVLPNMMSWKGGALVLDVKGEIFDTTGKWRSENVGPVYKFSPLNPSDSHNYNPLVFIRQDTEFVWEDSRFLADMMIVPSGASDPFWENMARDVLTSAIAYVCQYNPADERPMSKVIDILYGIGYEEMLDVMKTNVLVGAMRRTGHALATMEPKTKDGVLKAAQSSLSTWQGERIEKITRKSDWNPLDLRDTKATVYICINPAEIDSYLSILRVFIAQHIRMLTSQLPGREATPVLFMLDELPRLKKMPPIDEALNVGRQYGIKLWMFAQSYGQLKEAYANPEGLLGSCVVRTFMNVPLNDELATKLSDQLGFRDGPLDATRQKLVEPLELAGPAYKDTVLVLASNTKPAKVQKRFHYQSSN